MAEVEISYKGSNIATMNASGTKTLLTEAKYMEDDVTVTYTRPAAPSGTKNISITQNGTTTEDVTNYASAQITANVPNTYAAGDEGKVVDNGALVSQTSATYTTNDTYDTTLIDSVTVNVSGGGGIDFSDISQDLDLNNLGGLFKAFEDGTWDSLELTVTSGTNPIVINYGRAIKGCIAYPKSKISISEISGEALVFGYNYWNDPDQDGVQTVIWEGRRAKSGSSGNLYPRVASYTMANGVLSLVPSFPTNAAYHPFRFNVPYIFVYWWEETA